MTFLVKTGRQAKALGVKGKAGLGGLRVKDNLDSQGRCYAPGTVSAASYVETHVALTAVL